MVGHLNNCGHLVALLGVEVVGKPAIRDDAHFPADFQMGFWNTHLTLSVTSSKLTEQWVSSLLQYTTI